MAARLQHRLRTRRRTIKALTLGTVLLGAGLFAPLSDAGAGSAVGGAGSAVAGAPGPPAAAPDCARNAIPATSGYTDYRIEDSDDFRRLTKLPPEWGVYTGATVGSYFSPSHVRIMNDGVHGQALYIEGYPDGHHLALTTGGLQDDFNAVSGGFSVCLDFDTLNTTKGAIGAKVVVISWPHDGAWPQHGEIDALEGNTGHWTTATAIGTEAQYPTANPDHTASYYNNFLTHTAWEPIVFPKIDATKPIEVTALWDPVNGIRVYYNDRLINHVRPSDPPANWYRNAYGAVGRNIAIQTQLVTGADLAGTTANARVYWVQRLVYAPQPVNPVG